MAGFETFESNSFEQLCINYSNEHMQLFFNRNVILDETLLYKQEALAVGQLEIEIPDIEKTIGLLGFLALLGLLGLLVIKIGLISTILQYWPEKFSMASNNFGV